MSNKRKQLKQRCMDVMNQNEWINPLFDKSASIYIEARDEFLEQENTFYTTEAMERATFQHSYHEFLFSLLEDIHRYTYLATCEIYLYEERLTQKNDSNFFSSRYFLSNASHHIIGVWERSLRLSGLIYGYDFNKGSWKYSQIYRALKKGEAFVNSKVFGLLKNLVENNHLSAIEALRLGNDHELSVHVKFEKDDDLQQLAESCFINVKALYEVIHYCIDRFQKECFVRVEPIDLARFRWSIPLNSVKFEELIPKELTGELYSRLEDSFKSLSSLIRNITGLMPIAAPYLRQLDDKSKYILRHTDPIFRLHEATNSLRFAYNLMGGAKETDQELHEVTVCFKNMDYTYFIEAAITRIYSVYDKVAVLLHQHTGLGEISTFEQFIRHYSDQSGNNPKLLSHALDIYETEEYKDLHQLRQDNFHHIVKENYIHHVDGEWSHANNMINASKNIEILFPLLTEMFDILKEKLLSIEGL